MAHERLVLIVWDTFHLCGVVHISFVSIVTGFMFGFGALAFLVGLECSVGLCSLSLFCLFVLFAFSFFSFIKCKKIQV